MKFFLASFNRASDGALKPLRSKLKEKNMWATNTEEADCIIAVGDRTETFDVVYKQFKQNKPIIHLWAGEKSCWATHDDVWRHSMTLMSDMQLCINEEARERAMKLCWSVGKESNAQVIGNIFLEGIVLHDSFVPPFPSGEYDVVLYNPVTRGTEKDVNKELMQIIKIVERPYIWIEPNGDKYSGALSKYVNSKNMPREYFLNILHHCRKFITNSSCQYFEAPLVMEKKNIISIGKRNKERESKYSDLTIINSTDKIIKALEEYKCVLQER